MRRRFTRRAVGRGESGVGLGPLAVFFFFWCGGLCVMKGAGGLSSAGPVPVGGVSGLCVLPTGSGVLLSGACAAEVAEDFE